MASLVGPDLNHPDAIVRLAAAVHQFRCPEIGSKKLSFVSAFRTMSGGHANTKSVMEKADVARRSLLASLAGARTDSSSKRTATVSYESVANSAKDYVPLIRQILLSCEVQPETARLDERLVFEWTSGVEAAKQRKTFKSEAMTYEVAMTIACEGIGIAGMACDEGTAGNFVTASKHFKVAAGQFEFLAQDQLPKWIARGSDASAKDLPCEATVGTCEALKLLYLAYAQQMAVCTVLDKPGVPNYSLLAKLCLGTAEQLDHAITTFRTKAVEQAAQLDSSLFTLVDFQTALQRTLSLYFLARSYWGGDEYGLAIGLLKEAIALTQSFPATDKKSGLAELGQDMTQLRSHLTAVLTLWEKDNASIYFDGVPSVVPASKKLETGLSMMKPETYAPTDIEPLPLYPVAKMF